jgi:hypothetical protein
LLLAFFVLLADNPPNNSCTLRVSLTTPPTRVDKAVIEKVSAGYSVINTDGFALMIEFF